MKLPSVIVFTLLSLTFIPIVDYFKSIGGIKMSDTLNELNPRYIIDEKGRKTSVVLNVKEYDELINFIEDLEDTRDLLKAELEATEFTPYEEFRKRWLGIE